jgi:hypothetical protein
VQPMGSWLSSACPMVVPCLGGFQQALAAAVQLLLLRGPCTPQSMEAANHSCCSTFAALLCYALWHVCVRPSHSAVRAGDAGLRLGGCDPPLLRRQFAWREEMPARYGWMAVLWSCPQKQSQCSLCRCPLYAR